MIDRVSAFASRNRGAVLQSAIREMMVRPWIRYRAWRFAGPLSRSRTPETWVFMGGCYNSGTTILREILSAHPEIATLPREGVVMTSEFPDLEQGGWNRMWHRNGAMAGLDGVDPVAVAKTASRDWSRWWSRDASVFLEKSIVHGAWMPFLEAGFGTCRFIGVVRNGLCAAEGIRRRARPTGNAAIVLGQDQYPMEEAAAQWVESNARLMRDRTQVTHYLELRYEALVADPVQTMRRIFEFLNVDGNILRDIGDGQIALGRRRFRIRNDNPASLGRLTQSDRDAFFSVADPMMGRLGYSDTDTTS